jgi:hypothetical protein
LSIWRGLSASPSAGTVAITWANAPTAALWVINQYTGVDTSGTDGSGAIVQFADDVVGTGNTALTVTLASFGDATNNMGAACFGYNNQGTFTAETGNGWAELVAESVIGTPNAGLGNMYKTGEDTTALGTIGTSSRIVGVGIEIKMAAAGASPCGVVGGKVIRANCSGDEE